MDIYKAGIDTLSLEHKTNLDIKKMKINGILDKYTKITSSGNKILTFKPSKENGICENLTGVKESLNIIKGIEIKMGLNHGELKRVDISADSTDKIEDNKNLLRLFLECLNLKRGGNKKIFFTKKGINEFGNLKISSKRVQTTIYSCLDKTRMSNTRIENRILDIRIKAESEEIIKKEIKKYINELNDIHELVDLIEEKYINELINIYKININNKFNTFTGFIEWADFEGLILTSRILKGLIFKIKLKTSYKNFALNFKRKRSGSLKFTSKTELIKLINNIKLELKSTLKK